METLMTVTDLVKDTCKEAARRTANGDTVLVRSGHRALFKCTPVFTPKNLDDADLAQLERDLSVLAGNAENNPVLKLRERRA